ncbi:unnamed protein product [Urochloa decumbens]|uniref:NB-ARC domain-containing protein n=1 Tax=Urochloa decumbens TaxID=240449 RepID=A0ABC9AIW0_9POAL
MVVSPLVGGVLGAVTSNVVALVIKLACKGYELWSDFEDDIESIKRDLLMIAGAEEDQFSGKMDLSAVTSTYMKEIHDLALEIEDFLDRILRHAVEPNHSPLYEVLGFPNQLELEAKVKKLRMKLKEAEQRKSGTNVKSSQPSTNTTPSSASTSYTTKIGPVGIDIPKREIVQMVLKDSGFQPRQPEQLSVISIVGFSGSGKTTLAVAVYDCKDINDQFDCKAWVVASKHKGNTLGLLTELFEKLSMRDMTKGDVKKPEDKILSFGDVEKLKVKIYNYLKITKRFLIILDDINDIQWLSVKSSFPKNRRGTIIVTTTSQQVAKVCCAHGYSGYVYNMRNLDEIRSMDLLKAVLDRHLQDLEHKYSTSVVNKCDGHPLAIVNMANYLQSKHVVLTQEICEALCRDLGFRMETENTFMELRDVLMNNYISVPKEFLNLKTCLLYLCVFPNGCNIRGSRLKRRWFAEGYVQHSYPRSDLVIADDHLKKLVEQSIIWATDTSKNANVKTCRAHGIFHEFLMHMSTSSKFITSLENGERRWYRHLFVHNKSSGKSRNKEEKFRAHSLTICGSAGEAVRYFLNCELLRVLDLEECEDLQDKHVDGVHKLWYLKYLSVGGTISRLPNHIEKLHWLETLDTRKTKKEIILPVEVIKLPHLAHLLGRFKLGNKRDCEESEPEQYLPEQSNLQTLAGFVKDNNPMFPMIMDHMKQLRKVKIWAIWRNSTAEDPDLERAIQNFVQAEQDTGVSVRSLSIDIGNSSGIILRSLALGCLRSLQLHGKLRGFIHFVKSLYSLKELCISSTNHLTEEDLSHLRHCKDLEYLKLIGVFFEKELVDDQNEKLGGLVIASGDFRGLLRLYLVQCPIPTIEEGALPNLLSLRLLNQHLTGLCGIKMNQHTLLEELALDSEVNQKIKEDWEDAAKNHPKRPNVLFLKRVDPDETGSVVKYVATERSAPLAPEMEQPSLASTELSNGREEGMSSSSTADPDSWYNIAHKAKHRVTGSF